jgi:uncharacterized protein (UPF0333 family)
MRLKTLKAQTSVEYLLVFALVIVILLAAFAPNGFITRSVESSVRTSFNSVTHVAGSTYYNVYEEAGTCVCRTAGCLECLGT